MIGFLLAKLRNRRYAVQNKSRRDLIFGTIYKLGAYQGFKRDPAPMIYVMYSGPMTFTHVSGHYTDGINLNYLSSGDKMWLARMIYLMKKGNQRMNGAMFYRFLKTQRPNIVRTAYRRYKTPLIKNPRMISSGITHLDKLVYPYNDPWIQGLNRSITQQELNATGVQVAYNSTELRDRISSAQQSRPISQVRQTRGAPWIRKV